MLIIIIIIINKVLIKLILNKSYCSGTLHSQWLKHCESTGLTVNSGTVMSSNANKNTAAMACLWQQLALCSMRVMRQRETRGLPEYRPLDGTKSVGDEADRRRWRAATSVLKWRDSARYDGAVPWRHRYARTHNQNLLLSEIPEPVEFMEQWSYVFSLPRW